MANPLVKVKKLAKFLSYVLGRRPDEFGLLTDPDGFVDTKLLLKALNEEEGWRYVRKAHLNEVITTLSPAPVEINANRIRSKEQSRLPVMQPAEHLPKLLYMAIRRRAYGAALENGLRASHRKLLLLSSDKMMALRLGRRIDNEPVILTVQVANSLTKGVLYQQYGDHLYLADAIPRDTFSGPAPPKERPQRVKHKVAEEPATAKTPGSYFPDIDPFHDPSSKASDQRRRKKADWKKARRHERRHKTRQQFKGE